MRVPETAEYTAAAIERLKQKLAQPGQDAEAIRREISKKAAHLRNLEIQEAERNLTVPAMEPMLKTWRGIRESYLRCEVDYAAKDNMHIQHLAEEAVELLLIYLFDQSQFETCLQERLDYEVTQKRAVLHRKLTPIVGDVTDVKGMLISTDSSINGVVKGTKGRALVQTIWSGGESSQRRHTYLRVTQL